MTILLHVYFNKLRYQLTPIFLDLYYVYMTFSTQTDRKKDILYQTQAYTLI